MRRANSVPLLALTTAALLPGLGHASSITKGYAHTAGSAQNVAVTVLGTPGTGHDATVVTATIDSSGAIVVTAYKDVITASGTSTAGLDRIGSASDNGGCCGFIGSSVAITPLDATRVATAVVGVEGLLWVQTWSIGAKNVTETAADSSSYSTGGLDVTSLAIAAISPSEVITAARYADWGNLVVMDWSYVPGNGFENPVDYTATMSGVIAEGRGNLSMLATQSNQVTIAECDNSSQLKLLAWKVGASVAYTPTLEGSKVITSGCPVAVDTTGGINLLGGAFVSTASLATDGALRVATSDVTAAGAFAAPTLISGWPGKGTQVALCGTCSIDGYPDGLTALLGLNGNLWLTGAGLSLDTKIAVWNGYQDIGIAAEGLVTIAGKSAFRFVTASVDPAGKLEIDTWNLE
jgi:hypothetical protein